LWVIRKRDSTFFFTASFEREHGSSGMTNAFEILGIEPRLVLVDEELREAFRTVGKEAHPDAGGDDGEFASLREAFAVVSSPSRRLRHWLELRGLAPETRGTIQPELMDLFSEVGAATQQAESLIRRRDEAKSVLVRAMLENETQLCRELIEKAISRVEAMIQLECSVFPEMEKAVSLDVGAASTVARSLAFLEKWRAGLRANFSRLV
jgi:curved DNA-binding protein CbpA